MNRDLPEEAKPIRLAATGRMDLNMGTRSVTLDCAHPDGLLGKFIVALPFHMLKQAAGMLQRVEGENEEAHKKAEREAQRPKLELHTQ